MSVLPKLSASADTALAARSLMGRSVALALLAAMLWGTTGTAQSLAPAGLSSYWIGALRLLVACVFFALLALALGRTSPGRSLARDLAALPRWPVLSAGLCMAAYNLAFFAGLRATDVAVGTALAIGSGPIWAGLLQLVIARRPPSSAWIAGTALALGGGLLMLQRGPATPALNASADWALGTGLCLLAGLAYAAYTLLSQRLVQRAAPTTVTLAVFTSAALLAAPAAWVLAGPLQLHASDALLLCYLGGMATGVAYLLFNHALRHLSGATGVTLALAEPVTAFILAVAVLGERPAVAAYLGLCLMLAGLALVVRAELRDVR